MNRRRWGRLTGAIVAISLLAGCTSNSSLRSFPSVASGQASAGDRNWEPRAGLRWQIQLTGDFRTNATANVYDLDAYRTAEQTVTELHALGRQTMCHLDVGVSDLTVPDAGRLRGPVLGTTAGPGLRWLDIRRWADIGPVLADRVALCHGKGFDAVDADYGYGYAAETGFPLTASDQVAYDRKVADLVHSLGMAVTVRTPPALAAQIEPLVDFTVVNDCFRSASCHDYFVYIDANKAVFDVETDPGPSFCSLARAYGFTAIRKNDSLDAYVQSCV